MKNIIAICLLIICSTVLMAQTNKSELNNTIILKDSLFWKAYNGCDIEGMKQFLANDLEFYHDKNGLTLGLNDLITATKNNLCGNPNYSLKREVVKGSIKVFPLNNSDKLYGAVISGEHVFYVSENGKEPRLDGLAKFTHIWILKNDVWKMSRIISYDHGPAPYMNKRNAINLKEEVLNQYIGNYTASHAGTLKVERDNDTLLLLLGGQKMVLYPQSATNFFMKERDLTFDFSKDSGGKTSKITIRENGKIVDEALIKR